MSRRVGAGSLACVALAACAVAVQGAEPTKAGKSAPKDAKPNLEFLEYLGTLESDSENWTDVVNVDLHPAPKEKSAEASDKSKAEAAARKAEAAAKDAGGEK